MLKSILTAGAIVFLGVATASAQTTGSDSSSSPAVKK